MGATVMDEGTSMAGLLWPISGHHTTQRFAGQHPFEPALFLSTDAVGPRRARSRPFEGSVPFAHLHGAIDISCPIGTKIIAPEAGRIVAASTYVSTGEHFMMLQIKPGTILFFTHLSDFIAKVGTRVERGDAIARSGNSGMSTGPHLHWEVRVTTRPDPDFRLSGRWFKWNPRRLRLGRDLAGLRAIVPPDGQGQVPGEPAQPVGEGPEPFVEAPEPSGLPPDPLGGPPEPLGEPVEPVEIETDPDPEEEFPEDDEPDTFGDGATILDPPQFVVDPATI